MILRPYNGYWIMG